MSVGGKAAGGWALGGQIRGGVETVPMPALEGIE